MRIVFLDRSELGNLLGGDLWCRYLGTGTQTFCTSRLRRASIIDVGEKGVQPALNDLLLTFILQQQLIVDTLSSVFGKQ